MKDSTLQKLFKWSFYVKINLNDTFHYGSTDSELVSIDDLEDLEPLIEEFEFDAILAYIALMRGYDPEIASLITPEYKEAKMKLEEMIKNSNNYFLHDLKQFVFLP